MMKKLFFFIICCFAGYVSSEAQLPTTIAWGEWQSWGEQTDGTYRNPIIPADYSDLDCIRVGDDYYAISSTMQFSPGMTILHSRDLVNWEIAGNAVSDLLQISDAMTWRQMDRYGRGIWAGTLRYHKGRFYLFFGTPDEGFFMTTAKRAEGPWEPLTPLLQEKGWDDCSAIWDEQGQAWFVGTCFADGYKTYIFRMAKDGRSIDRSSARLVNEGNGREANKLIYHDGYYYLVFSEHRDGVGRYVMAKRDRKITGSFSEEQQLLLPCREANEPNQGGIIEGPDKKWYFLTHHGTGDWGGRIVSLLPVEWVDGWPMMGDRTKSSPGTMVWQGAMLESERVKSEKLYLQRSDDFDASLLAPQWQWNYQPRDEMWSLTERPSWLRLYAFTPLPGKAGAGVSLLMVGNTLTQRSFRTAQNEVIVKLDISHTADGLHAGLCHFAANSASLGILNEGGTNYLEWTHNDQRTRYHAINESFLYLRSTWGLDGLSQFSYSLDGDHYTPLGQYQLSWGFYRGDRIGIYCYNEKDIQGYIDVDYFHYDMMRAKTKLVMNPVDAIYKDQSTLKVTAWGDQGDGTYVNPVLNSDFSDPDVIRVGEKFYMVASDFHFMGMQVLESDDMVNWQYVSQIYNRIEEPGWDDNQHYGGGSWAPAIRYHNGRFYVYFCTPDEGLYMTSAVDAHGPWEPLHLVKRVGKWEDPCPLWDDDGQAYLGRSQHGAGPIIVHKMSADGRQLLDDGVNVYNGPVAEGTKWLKRNGYYYLIIPEGGVGTGWQTVLRATNIYGPYERRIVLEQGTTNINGPHQGALVDAPDGSWWFYHFQDTPELGRVVHLQPARWVDQWPLMGVDLDDNGIGEPVRSWQKPIASAGRSMPQTDDDFSGPLGLQWQWNHNPQDEAWSLTERKGYLTLHALPANNLKESHNMLTQKVMGYVSESTTLVTAQGNCYAGLACIGQAFHGVGITPKGIYVETEGQRTLVRKGRFKRLYLRVKNDCINHTHQFFYSTDGKNFMRTGESFSMHNGYWKGIRVGLFCYGDKNGCAYFDNFTWLE